MNDNNNLTIGGLYKNPMYSYQCYRNDGSVFSIERDELFVIVRAIKIEVDGPYNDRYRCTILSTQGEISRGVFLNAGDLEEVKE